MNCHVTQSVRLCPKHVCLNLRFNRAQSQTSHRFSESQRWRTMTLYTSATLPPRHSCITEPPICTHTHAHGAKLAKMTSQNTFSSSQLDLLITFSFSHHLDHLEKKKCIVLSRWLSIPGFLYPYTTLHSRLMANYIKYNGLIMLDSENEDLTYGTVHFVFSIILNII